MPPKTKQFAKTQPLPLRNKPRWEQLAAVTAVPVSEFRGYADIKSNAILRPISSLSRRSSASSISTSRSKQTKTTTSSQKANDILNDPECISIRDHVEEPNKLDEYDNKFLMKLATHLRIYSQDLMCKGNYAEARKVVNRKDYVTNVCRSRKPVEEKSNDDVADLEQIIKDYKEKWARELDEFDKETEQKISDIEKRNQEKLVELDNDWENNIVEQYRKPSAHLIRQRTLEARMIQTDQLESAAYIHQSVHQLEEIEANRAQEQFVKDYNEARQAAIYKNQQEIDQFKFSRETQRNFLLQNIKKDQNVMNNRLAVLKLKPKPLEPYKHPSNEVAARPSAALNDSEDLRPGKKLPMLNLPKGNRNKCRNSATLSKSNSQGLLQNSNNNNRNRSENERENNRNDKLDGGELIKVSAEITNSLTS